MAVIDTQKDLSSLFVQQAKATPDAVALEDEGVAYTYSQLDKRVAHLAQRLRSQDVGRDSLVGVLLNRSADYVIACLAALRAGGAFLVLELAYPPDLLAEVVDDSNPTAVITYGREAGRIKNSIPLLVLDEDDEIDGVDSNGTEVDGVNGSTQEDDDLDRLAFVSYSSGTTGRPKGIANPHRAAVHSYDRRFAISDLKPGDRVACNVFFIWEILRPLLRGATVIAVPDEASYDPVALVDLLAAKRVSETLMTPTLLATILSRHSQLGARLPDLRNLWLNGEVVTTDLARRAVKALPNVRLLNCYSACETHEIACGDIADMLTDHTELYCPVGPPLDPKHTYVLDESGFKVAPGVSGELFVGGSQLAREYLNRPETTAQAFTQNTCDPDALGTRLYRTGDRARVLPSGLLEVSGRVGTMIKLRGYSVVPGKVENAIVSHLGVSDCAVVANGEGVEKQLVAYIVHDKDNTDPDRPSIEVNESGHSPTARRALSAYLAHYMIPALWVELPELPTHEVSGKADFNRLPPPPSAIPKTVNGKKAERDPIGIDAIANIWAATLKVSRGVITPEQNFFDLGGHSLSIADLASRLSREFGLRIPLSRLVEPATLKAHLETVRAVRDGHTAALQADLPAVLRQDSLLDEDIRPVSSDGTMCSLNKANTVLLTGVTGFLGAFLLNDLLERTSARIICLVRFNDPSDEDSPGGHARIRRNLLDLGLWRDTIMERVEILPGNLSRKRFGLSPDVFDDLASRVQVIIHAAATVNLVYPYAALRGPNVGGTREILRLACHANATVQYVSTNGVLPPSDKAWPEDSMLDVDSVPTKLADGYGQTKWVAEQLVVEAGRRGLPVRILRAGTISGHSTTGAANAWDLLSALLVESIHLGYFPDVPGWRAEMTPVDFVSRAIIHLSNQTHATQLVFHLGDPNPVDTSAVFGDLQQLGYPTSPLSWDKWVSLWEEKRGTLRGGDGAFTIDILRGGMPSVEFLRGIVVLDNTATRPFRAGVERPKVNAVLLETYARHWFARGWLPRAPICQDSAGGSAQPICRGPLSGRVAVITGASSGIGAAVAAALSREGVHVALGARRLKALEAVKAGLTVRESKAIVRQTDVTDRKQVEALVQAANEELGPVDVLVSCAGVMYFTMMANVQMDEWERTVDVNCRGLLNCLAATVPGMLERCKSDGNSDTTSNGVTNGVNGASSGAGDNGCHIVAISSDAARKVFPGLGVYSASKFFVEATLQSLRLETAGTGLRVTGIQPGNTATDLLDMSSDTEAVEKYGGPSAGKILEPANVADAIVFALRQPAHVAVNEIMVEPRDEPI